MKRIALLVLSFMKLHAMEELALIPAQPQTGNLSDVLKEHVLEISISSLYLAGAFPFLSDDIRWACDISGSILWLSASTYSLIKVIFLRRNRIIT